MNRLARNGLIGLTLVALLGGGGLYLKKQKETKDIAAAAAKPAPVVIPIEINPADIARAENRDLARTLPLTGALNPQILTYVKAKVAGEVREMQVREGDKVSAGQLIARIDALELNAKFAQAQGALESAQASFDLAKKTLENNRNLLAKNFISQNSFDNAQSGYLVAEGNLKAAKAAVTLAKKAQDDAVVRAPISGIVATRNAQPGEKVAVDARLYQIMDLGKMEVEVSVPASDIASVVIGQEANFKVEGFGEKNFKGTIARINPATQAGSRSIFVYAVLPNEDNALRGGMFAKGTIKLGAAAGALVVPATAVREDGQGKFVYTIDGNKLVRSSVELGAMAEDEGLVQVLKGLSSGVTLVKSNLGELRVGATVAVSTPVAPKAKE